MTNTGEIQIHKYLDEKYKCATDKQKFFKTLRDSMKKLKEDKKHSHSLASIISWLFEKKIITGDRYQSTNETGVDFDKDKFFNEHFDKGHAVNDVDVESYLEQLNTKINLPSAKEQLEKEQLEKEQLEKEQLAKEQSDSRAEIIGILGNILKKTTDKISKLVKEGKFMNPSLFETFKKFIYDIKTEIGGTEKSGCSDEKRKEITLLIGKVKKYTEMMFGESSITDVEVDSLYNALNVICKRHPPSSSP
jgi:hypothetical protein